MVTPHLTKAPPPLAREFGILRCLEANGEITKPLPPLCCHLFELRCPHNRRHFPAFDLRCPPGQRSQVFGEMQAKTSASAWAIW